MPIQRKGRIWKVKWYFLHTQEKANACGKFQRNLKGKHIENCVLLNSMDSVYPL